MFASRWLPDAASGRLGKPKAKTKTRTKTKAEIKIEAKSKTRLRLSLRLGLRQRLRLKLRLVSNWNTCLGSSPRIIPASDWGDMHGPRPCRSYLSLRARAASLCHPQWGAHHWAGSTLRRPVGCVRRSPLQWIDVSLSSFMCIILIYVVLCGSVWLQCVCWWI